RSARSSDEPAACGFARGTRSRKRPGPRPRSIDRTPVDDDPVGPVGQGAQDVEGDVVTDHANRPVGQGRVEAGAVRRPPVVVVAAAGAGGAHAPGAARTARGPRVGRRGTLGRFGGHAVLAGLLVGTAGVHPGVAVGPRLVVAPLLGRLVLVG